MLTIWKKRKDGKEKQMPTAPMWLQTFNERYDGAFGEVQEKRVEQSQIIHLMIQGDLEVITKKPIDSIGGMYKVIESMADEYDGPFLAKPVIISTYIILGSHLVKQNKNNLRSNSYKNAFNEALAFKVNANVSIPPKGIQYTKYINTYYLGDPATISFNITINPTKRRGKDYKEVYQIPMINGSLPPDINNTIKSYGLKYEIDEEGEQYLDMEE